MNEAHKDFSKVGKFTKDHTKEQIIGDPSKGIMIRSKALSE